MLERYKTQNTSILSKWDVGDIINLSEQQKSLLDERNTISILDLLIIPYCSFDDLEAKILTFISSYKELCVRIKECNGKVIQQIVAKEKLRIKFKYRKVAIEEKMDDLKEYGIRFLKSDCDPFNDELIRVVVYYNDEKKEEPIYVVIGIHYLLIDMHTNTFLSKNLINFFNNKPINLNYISIFEYIVWQQEYLLSSEGLVKRKYWIDLLSKLSFNNDAWSQVNNNREFISHKITITGNKLKTIEDYSKKTNLPMSSILMALHQRLINSIFIQKNYLQLVRVNNRERIVKEIEISNVFGMIANTIPLQVNNNNKLSYDLVLEVFSQYCNARLNLIPYEILKNDFNAKTSIDINSFVIGLFNYYTLDIDKTLIKNRNHIYSNIENISKQKNAFNLYCTLYNNSLVIEIAYQPFVFYENSKKINLMELVENEFSSLLE